MEENIQRTDAFTFNILASQKNNLCTFLLYHVLSSGFANNSSRRTINPYLVTSLSVSEMQCCSVPCADTNRFFSRLAGLHRVRYRLFGPEKTQKQLMNGIRNNLADASIMEVGCGTGDLHQELLQRGAASAVGVDISLKMINEARRNAINKALADRTEYHLGDYVDLAGDLGASDVTIMDKVVCCYPDPERLLKTVLPNTRQAIALTYPRDRTFTRVAIATFAMLMRMLKSDFRPYVHNPDDIRRWITEEGFSLESLERVFAWQTEVYVRAQV